MTLIRRTASVLMLAGVLAAAFGAALPAIVLGADPTYGQPSVSATLGQPLSFSSTITGDDIASVDVVVRLDGEETGVIVAAAPGSAPDTWQAIAPIDVATSALCACLADGQSAPNTSFNYQFKVRAADGSTTLGPVGEAVVTDDRFAWRTFDQDLVSVHWYEGTDAFAQAAAQVANDAIDRASSLLGTQLPNPVDLFIYATEEDMRSAISPNRENVAGQAHSSIDTMFVNIGPNENPATGTTATLVAHELTHLVMNEATANPYHGVPRWIDEGVAVYLSEGYNSYWQAPVNGAVSSRTLIPLDGLRGLFPSSRDEFYLAYGESVAAIDYFIRTYGEETLWALVGSYAEGVSDDDAFTAATGADVAAFNAAWFGSLGLNVPPPVGPQPGAPGPTPADWQGQPGQQPSPGASTPASSPDPAASPTTPGSSPAASSGPSAAPAPATGDNGSQVGAIAVGVVAGLVFVAALVLIVVVTRRNRAQPPPLV
ncbi:MAG TPA: peptidase MA family metallohydrolase [Candidatus Limnocylindrales bacterium]|nr:peptidase MA family metallohydrolase [Candidatus Limnocylindrales bacterium]